MSDAPKMPDDGESTLSNEKPGAWENVTPPAQGTFLPPVSVILPPGAGYAGGQGYVPPPPPNYPPPPSGAQAGQGGYRPVYDGGATGVPPPGAYGAPGYGAQPPNYPPPGYGGQAPYGQQGYYPQNNYSNAADMLAAAVLIPRWRRRRRRLFVFPVLFLVIMMVFLLHGCVSFLRIF